MWIKTRNGTLFNTNTAFAIWITEHVGTYTSYSHTIDGYDVKLVLNDNAFVLDHYETPQAAQNAIDLIGEALRENRSLFDMREIPKEGITQCG